MRRQGYGFLFVFLLLSTAAAGLAGDPADFDGSWSGSGIFLREDGETTSGTLLVTLSVGGMGHVTGGLSYGGTLWAVDGFVAGDELHFTLASPSPGCDGWSVAGSMRVEQGVVLEWVASGMVCDGFFGSYAGVAIHPSAPIATSGIDLPRPASPEGGGLASDFAGYWIGPGLFLAEDGETHSGQMRLFLEEVVPGHPDGAVVGSFAYQELYQEIAGSVVNAELTFAVPNPEPGNPDCASFDVTATATQLAERITTLVAPGTSCGGEGGKVGTFVSLMIPAVFFDGFGSGSTSGWSSWTP